MNKFSNKTIERRAEQTVTGTNCIDLDVDGSIDADDGINHLESIGVWVDAYSDLRPFEDDYVKISLVLNGRKPSPVGYLDLEIDSAEKLGKLLLSQCKVARRAQEKKRQILGTSVPET